MSFPLLPFFPQPSYPNPFLSAGSTEGVGESELLIHRYQTSAPLLSDACALTTLLSTLTIY